MSVRPVELFLGLEIIDWFVSVNVANGYISNTILISRASGRCWTPEATLCCKLPWSSTYSNHAASSSSSLLLYHGPTMSTYIDIAASNRYSLA